MLTCKELTELITDYVEGKLSFLDKVRFQMHLGMCKHCRAYLNQIKATIQTLGKLQNDRIPSDVRDQLLQRFKSWKR